MKNNLRIIIHSLITASSCIAMENELDLQKYIRFEKPKILSEITIIEKPWQAEYLDENRILVNGKDGCCIIDPRTNQEIKRIDVKAPHFAIHPTSKKIAFAGEKPAIYNSVGDLETIIKTEGQSSATKCVFDPFHNDVLLGCDSYSQPYNCETGYGTGMLTRNISLVAFHPTEELRYIYQPKTHKNMKSAIEIRKSKLSGLVYISLNNNCNSTHMFCSPNGSLIAIKNKEKNVYIIKKDRDNYTQTNRIELAIAKGAQSIINPLTNNPTYIDMHNNWVYMKFHPNSAVLAAVLLLWVNHEPHQMVFYWDVLTQQILATTPALPTIEHRNDCENIAFSPNGRKIIIVSPDKCTILPVPCEVLYDTTTKLPYLYWFLSKECLAQHDIPDDVQKIVAFNVLEKFKR